MTWSALTSVADTGGATITSYQLDWATGPAPVTWSVLVGNPTPDTSLSHLVTSGVTAGQSYQFRLRAQNEVGWGAYSPILTVVPSSPPAQMAAPTVTVSTVYTRLDWVAPNDNGASLTAYKILLIDSNNAFIEESTYCAGADATVMANRYCQIPMAALRAAPYSLAVGTLVQAKVQA